MAPPSLHLKGQQTLCGTCPVAGDGQVLCDQDGISWVQDGAQPMTSSHSSDKRGPQARQRDTQGWREKEGDYSQEDRFSEKHFTVQQGSDPHRSSLGTEQGESKSWVTRMKALFQGPPILCRLSVPRGSENSEKFSEEGSRRDLLTFGSVCIFINGFKW